MKVSREHGCFKIRQKKACIKCQMQNQNIVMIRNPLATIKTETVVR